jgi:hypothetical protein
MRYQGSLTVQAPRPQPEVAWRRLLAVMSDRYGELGPTMPVGVDGARQVHISLTVDKPDPSTAAVELVSTVSRSILLAGIAGAYVSAQEIRAAPRPGSGELVGAASDIDRPAPARSPLSLRVEDDPSR